MPGGAWIDDEVRAAQDAEDLAMVRSAPSVTCTGVSAHTFEDGSCARTSQAWRNSFSVAPSNDGAELVVRSTPDGTTTAPCRATEDRIEIGAADVAGPSVEGRAEADTWACTCADGVPDLQHRTSDGDVAHYGAQVLRQR